MRKRRGGRRSRPKESGKPKGNRDVVRKHREKAADAIHLEDEAKRLHTLNHKLQGRLQLLEALEAEIVRLRVLLADFQAKRLMQNWAFSHLRSNAVALASNVCQRTMHQEQGDDLA
ncbi:hypothetical protein COCNU_16G002750 [Cocos nucifera]|uniref:BZIP domain-containing protein n=1 Tax=Cocos nucifera TaxID=13894 RepID=A0A8K0NDY1_COCNU|nr:hypothetical protein COCNU_16G002750 [Cocos nucifera]